MSEVCTNIVYRALTTALACTVYRLLAWCRQITRLASGLSQPSVHVGNAASHPCRDGRTNQPPVSREIAAAVPCCTDECCCRLPKAVPTDFVWPMQAEDFWLAPADVQQHIDSQVLLLGTTSTTDTASHFLFESQLTWPWRGMSDLSWQNEQYLVCEEFCDWMSSRWATYAHIKCSQAEQSIKMSPAQKQITSSAIYRFIVNGEKFFENLAKTAENNISPFLKIMQDAYMEDGRDERHRSQHVQEAMEEIARLGCDRQTLVKRFEEFFDHFYPK